MLERLRLNNIEVLISEAFIDSYISISYDTFISINNVLKEYNKIKEKINMFDVI